jgi:hypothetical protein
MPFPLAHSAAVLPLRRLCPRHLSFPALLIGSLSPDLGYFSGHFRLGGFSHSFWPGSFGFCLPAGLLVLLVFYVVRSRVVGILPARWRQVLLPLCQRPSGSPLVIVVSLLIGAWTHLFLDSICHEDGWLVEHLAVLRSSLPWVGNHGFRVYDALYAGCTFFGVTWLAVCYLRWLERAAGPLVLGAPGVKWCCALLFAVIIACVAVVSHAEHRSVGLFPFGVVTVFAVIGFLLATGIRSNRTGN